MKLAWKIVLIIIAAGIIIGFSIVYYMYHKPHRDIAGAKADFTMVAADLVKQYVNDQKSCNAKYLDKVIIVTGKIADLSHNGNIGLTIVLENQMEGINCAMDTKYFNENKTMLNSLANGSEVKIKGICSGFDDTFQCVGLDKCTIVK
ncbi:MAG: hypothetical protein NTW49_03700 [Bacteroidia bacterium]|nr:hypothetical protein [Bacteroidia bacterium]